MKSPWTGIENSPLEAGLDPESEILVWHVYQGALVEKCARYRANQFYTHWARINNRAWISTAERRPGPDDTDVQNCVIARDRWGNVSVVGWHRFEIGNEFVQWQHPPAPPPRITNKPQGGADERINQHHAQRARPA